MTTAADDVADVIVVGAGVAGATLAVMLGRAGLTVELLERHEGPREKACAEGVMPAGVGVLMRLGLCGAPGVQGQRFSGVRYVGWGREIESPFPAAPGVPRFGMGARRLHLDEALVEAARATPGVRVRRGVDVSGPLVESGRVRGVVADGRAFRARLTVGADGPRSGLRRALGLERGHSGRARIGVRTHFRLGAGQTPPSLVEVYLADDHELYMTPLPGGEVVVAGLGPRDDEPSQPGSGLDGSRKIDARFAAWRAHHPTLMQRLEGAQQVSALAGRTPLAVRVPRRTLPGFVLLGDAAGPVDPVTGSGMAQALLSAERLAARLARRPFHPSDDALEAFDDDRVRLLRDGRRLTAFVLALLRHPPLARGMVRALEKSPRLFSHLLGVAANAQPLMPA